MAHLPPHQQTPAVARPATGRGLKPHWLFDALYGGQTHSTSEVGAPLQKRQAQGWPDAGPAGFALDSGLDGHGKLLVKVCLEAGGSQ